jgi:hypothetical protein
MNLRARRTNDDLVLFDERRHLVALVEHVIDALACYRASEGDVAIHITSSHQTAANGCAISIYSCDRRNESRAGVPAVPERVAPAKAKWAGPRFSALGTAMVTAPFLVSAAPKPRARHLKKAPDYGVTTSPSSRKMEPEGSDTGT